MRGDRDVKLAGYQVFRIGATELQDREQARESYCQDLWIKIV